MDHLFRCPLFGHLNPVERSKLLPSLREVCLAPAERLTTRSPGEMVYLVDSGKVELRYQSESSEIRLVSLGALELLGETALVGEVTLPLTVVALEPARLIGLPVATFQQILRSNPRVLDTFTQTLLTRYAENLEEMAHLRRMVAAYADMFKEQLRTPEPPARSAIESAVALQAKMHDGPADPGAPGDSFSRRHRLFGLGAATVIAALVLVAPAQGLDVQTRRFLAVLTWGAVCWLFSALPDYVVGLATCLGVGLASGATQTVAWSGFAQPTWFLLLGVWVMGVAAGRSGLLYRLALHCLRLSPPTYAGRSLALALAGVVMTPLLPSPQGRIVMAAPLTQELGEAMQFPPHSKGSAGLAMASFLGFGEMYFLFLNGTTTGMLAWSLLPDAIRAKVTWTYWFLAALPLGALVFGLSFWAIMRLLPAEPVQAISADVISKQLSVLGPMRKNEWISLLVVLSVLAGFVTSSWHGIDSAWFALAGTIVLVSTEVVDRESLSRDVNWSFLLFFGSIMGIAATARLVHLDTALGQIIQPLLAPALSSPVAAVAATGIVTLILRLALSPIQVIPLLTIVMSPIFSAAGYNPFGAVLAIVTVSTTFAAPILSPAYVSMQAGTRESMFTPLQTRSLALAHSTILIVGLLVSAPYWVLVGAL